MPPDKNGHEPDRLLFRLPKKSLGLRGADPIFDLLDPIRHRAGDCGCGEVSRDELFAALVVAATRCSDSELHDLIVAYRNTSVGEIAPDAEASGSAR